MTKQAKKAVADAQNQQNQFKAQEMDLQFRFSKLTPEQRMAVANYLNAYNVAAWIFNEIIDSDCKTYVELAMKYTMETQDLAKAMHDLSDDPNDVQRLVDHINGEEN